MSIHSNTSTVYSPIKPSPSPSVITSSFARPPPIPPPNCTLHIANLRSDTIDGKTVQEDLEALLQRQTGFYRLKIKQNRNLIGCFGIAYFASIQCATDAKNNLQNHPFPGSSRGLRIDYMTAPKKDVGYPNLRVDAALQPRGLQHQRSIGAFTRTSWGQSLAVPIMSTRAVSLGPLHAGPPPISSELITEKVSTSSGPLGDKPFNFSYGAKASKKGLQGSIFSNVKAPDSESASSQRGEDIDSGSKPIPIADKSENIDQGEGANKGENAGKGEDPDSTELDNIIKQLRIDQETAFKNITYKEATKVKEPELLQFPVPVVQNDQENAIDDHPRQEQLKEMSHLARMMLAKKAASKNVVAKQGVALGKGPGVKGGSDLAAIEAKMIPVPQVVAAQEAPDSKSGGDKVIATKPEVAFRPKATIEPKIVDTPKLTFENWDDEF